MVAIEDGFMTHNPGQRWRTAFDDRGFTTTPDDGGWTWGLELMSYGWGDVQQHVERPRSIEAAGTSSPWQKWS
jgi:hypothetical protein